MGDQYLDAFAGSYVRKKISNFRRREMAVRGGFATLLVPSGERARTAGD